jgi:hypothetical protein
MQGIKLYTIIFFLILVFTTCKTKKEEEFVPLLKNGYYSFVYGNNPSVPTGNLYYLSNNNFYPATTNGKTDSICYSRKAGFVTKTKDVFSIPFLYISYKDNVCLFVNDLKKGDLGIYFIDSLTYDGKDINYPKFTGWAHYSYFPGDTVNTYFIFSRSYYQ